MLPVAPSSGAGISEDGRTPLTISSGLRIPNWTRFTGLSGAEEFSRAAILVCRPMGETDKRSPCVA